MLAFVALLGSAASTEWVDLTPDTFDDFVNDNDQVLIEFEAPVSAALSLPCLGAPGP